MKLQRSTSALLVCLLLLSACHGYVVHPGSINTFDSKTADVLLQAKTFIDNTKPLLTTETKPLWSELVENYNLALAAYQTWRAAAKKNPDSKAQLEELNRDLAILANAINHFKKEVGQ